MLLIVIVPFLSNEKDKDIFLNLLKAVTFQYIKMSRNKDSSKVTQIGKLPPVPCLSCLTTWNPTALIWETLVATVLSRSRPRRKGPRMPRRPKPLSVSHFGEGMTMGTVCPEVHGLFHSSEDQVYSGFALLFSLNNQTWHTQGHSMLTNARSPGFRTTCWGFLNLCLIFSFAADTETVFAYLWHFCWKKSVFCMFGHRSAWS